MNVKQRIVLLIGELLNKAAQALSGAIAYYACEGLSDWFVFREGVNQNIARLFFFLFPVIASTAFVVLTVIWHRVLPRSTGARFPEICMIIGVLIFMPIYFEVASSLIYNPVRMILSDVIEHLYWDYVLFPLTVMDFGTYTLSLHVFALTAVSGLVTGYLLRWRAAQMVS